MLGLLRRLRALISGKPKKSKTNDSSIYPMF